MRQVSRVFDGILYATMCGVSTVPLQASIVVPAYREAANLRTLIERLFCAVESAGLHAEMIIVDDNSDDGSVEIVRELADRFPVRIQVRTSERGLSSAVLAGFAEARGDVFVVMDADLQHPPEKVPELVDSVRNGSADFVIGSRYVDQGRIIEGWSFLRKLNSHAATLLARPLTSVRDPMSGFFALKRSTWEQAAKLDPIGYKIGLELIVKGHCRQCIEVPIEFAERHAGESKLNFSEQVRYVRHILRLYRFAMFHRRPG